MTWPARTMAETLALLTAPDAPFAMREETVGGHRLRNYVHMPDTLRTVFDASREFGERTFLAYEGETLSFEEHWRAASAFGRALIECYGIARGDRVSIAMRNYPEWSICAWGALAAGAILVPLNAWEAPETMRSLLDDCGSKVAVVDEQRLAALREAGPHAAELIVTRAPASYGVTDLTELIGAPSAYSRLPDIAVPDAGFAADDLATIFYTSGTTGRPKGAAGTHRNILTNYVNTAFRAARAAVRRGDPVPAVPSRAHRRLLLPLPLFHVTGFHSTLVPALANGSTLHLMYKWDVAKALDLIGQEKINALNLVPALALQLCDAIAEREYDTTSVDLVGYGGSAASPELALRVRSAFLTAFPGAGYGATETSSLVAANSHEDMMARPGSVGTAAPCCDLRIVDSGGREVAPGEPGELWVRGPNVVSGYWNLPEATHDSFVDGWYRTGDIASIDEEGFVTILDRLKDMLIRGGENIYCAEVEACLCRHPDVLDAAVFGIPERVLGEVVGAAVCVRRDARIGPDALSQFVAERLAVHKVPVAIDMRFAPLPRSATGKLLKREMRAALLKRLEPDSQLDQKMR